MASVTSAPRARTVLPFVAPASARRAEKVAVVLNANARNVNESVHREITRFIPAEDVFYSRDLAQARSIVSNILSQGYTTVLSGGGDGTFSVLVHDVLAELEDEEISVCSDGNAARKMVARRRPIRFGALRLGTGNSVAGLQGASSTSVGLIEDILRARSGDVVGTRRLHLIGSEGKLAPFAGVGIDAKILNDYMQVKNALASTPLGKLASGVSGYLMAVTGLSVPSILMDVTPPNVEIINEGAPAQQLGPDGRTVGRPIGTGEILYKGPCRLAAVGTVPAYGFNFTIFPHALRHPGRMQLRLTAMSVPELLRHIPAIWKGRTPCASLLDFSAEKVRLSFDRKMPFQIGGDAEGLRDSLAFAVDPRAVELLDFKSHG